MSFPFQNRSSGSAKLVRTCRWRYECAMKEKMLMRLERDRFAAKNETLQKQIAQYEAKDEGQDDEEKMQVLGSK